MKVLIVAHDTSSHADLAGGEEVPFGGMHDTVVVSSYYNTPEEAKQKALEGAPYNLIIIEDDWEGHTREVYQAAGKLSPNAVLVGPTQDNSWMEQRRLKFKDACRDIGILVPRTVTLRHPQDAIAYLLKHGEGGYAIKIEDAAKDYSDKLLTGLLKSPESAIQFLRFMQSKNMEKYDATYEVAPVVLEELISSKTHTETSVGAFFDGENFIEPFHEMIEYKRVSAGDLGANSIETGAHLIKLEKEDLEKPVVVGFKRFEKVLRESNYLGYFDVNFFVKNEDPSEFIAIECDIRYPAPAGVGLKIALEQTNESYADFCMDLAVGDAEWDSPKHIMTVATRSLGFPMPAPGILDGIPIFGLSKLIEERGAKPVEVEKVDGEYGIRKGVKCGVLAIVVGTGDTASAARRDMIHQLDSLDCWAMDYRCDIGQKPFVLATDTQFIDDEDEEPFV